MKLEAGKFYMTRDGRKVGPLVRITRDDHYHSDWVWRVPGSKEEVGSDFWSENGLVGPEGSEGRNDIVSECQDGPVITETVKRIVPGLYGTTHVTGMHGEHRVYVSVNGAHDAAQLRATAATLTEIADALEQAK